MYAMLQVTLYWSVLLLNHVCVYLCNIPRTCPWKHTLRLEGRQISSTQRLLRGGLVS